MKNLTGVLFIILFSLGISLQAQNNNFLNLPYIEVRASADTLVTPDNIYISINILESDTKGKVPVEELAHKMVKRLKALGIKTEKQLVLNDFSSNFKKYFWRGKEILKSKSYTLMVHSAVMAGKVLIALKETGIGHVGIQKVIYSKAKQMNLILNRLAVKNALLQAKAMVKPLDQQVGNALFITEVGNFSPMPVLKNARIFLAEAASPSPQPVKIQFQKIKLERSVNVRFALLPAK